MDEPRLVWLHMILGRPNVAIPKAWTDNRGAKVNAGKISRLRHHRPKSSEARYAYYYHLHCCTIDPRSLPLLVVLT